MLILRIRRAEIALKDGRLDEAFELARAEDVRAHRRGQQLIGQLARSLVERGRENLAAKRLHEAMIDGEKAGKLAGSLPEVAQLRSDVAEALRIQQQVERHQANVLAAAREHIENGRLSIGQQLLANAPEAQRAQSLREEVEARRARGASALARAQEAMTREDWNAAVDALLEARQLHPSNDDAVEVTAQVTDRVIQKARDGIDQGRLDQAELLLRRLAPLSSDTLAFQDIHRAIDHCRQAFAFIQHGQLHQATEILRRLDTMLPKTSWLRDALDNTEKAAERLEHLRGGPLSLLASAAAGPIVDDQATELLPPAIPSPAPGPVGVPASNPLPSRFMLHVDGVGSFLVLRDRQITIGPAGSSRSSDVALLADSGLPVTTIERNDEDYFVSASQPVHVNGTRTTRKLLSDGDRIELSPRCRLKFALPNAACTSAVLHMTGTRLQKSDARCAILLDKTLILGPGSSAHIRADTLSDQAVLYLHDGRLFCRSNVEVTVNGKPMDRMAGISIDARVTIGPVSLTITRV